MVLMILVLKTVTQAQTFSNPIADLADPHITYYNGSYYLTGTTGNNITVKKATTLNALKFAAGVVVFTVASGGPCCNFWAPELHRIDNKWYIYYTGGTNTNLASQRTWVIENSSDDPVTGTWANKGQIFHPTENFWAIDGSILSLNTKNYFLWSGYSNESNTIQRIYIAEMSNPWTLTGPRVLLSSPDYSWERNGEINEGPVVMKQNGKVFLVYSASGCWTPDYALGMLTMNEADNPMNIASWTKSAQPVFSTRASANAYGPGHNGFFSSPDGTEIWNVYHATTVAAGACDFTRTTRAQKVEWKPDGTPDFGVPVTAGDTLAAPAGEIDVPISVTLPNGIYRFVSKASTKVLDIAECSAALGADVIQNTWLGKHCQRWNVQATGDGFFVLTSLQGGLALDVAGCSNDNFANVQTWAPNGAPCQQWKIEDAGDGSYRLLARNSNKALTVVTNSTAEGANVLQQDWSAADGQRWYIIASDEVVTDSEENIAASVFVYPNPVRGSLVIEKKHSVILHEVMLTDLLSRTVYHEQVIDTEDESVIDTSNIPGGMYLLKVRTNQKEFTMKVMIER
jgi:GH43 family beta-xylosidase